MIKRNSKTEIRNPKSEGVGFGFRISPRGGFSLLEVLVAMAIFLFALVAISQLINLGADHAVEVHYQQRAIQICESKLAELRGGSVSLSSQSDVALDEDPDWTWSVDAEQSSLAGLWQVKVTAKR